ncbi:MAG TPA: hypothetical protein VKG45_03115 [Actinomycetes bacterium]|nr:hypothetical protein [Actinomycetes bacterium]
MPETPHDPELVARVKRDATERLLAIPNVVAVAVGPKLVGGRPTGEPAIRVFVRRKLPAEQVPPDELIPPDIDGVTTDVAVGGDPVPLADPPPVDRTGVIHPLTVGRDGTTYRPVVGGGQLTTVGSNGHGTLGCLLWEPGNHEVGYALTNMHVVHAPDITSVTKNVTKVGQPDGNDSSSKCCNDVIGVFAGGGKSDDRDEALVRLSPGMKWKAEIVELGLVAGPHTLEQAEVTGPNPYKVTKRGQRSGVTGGTVIGLDATTHENDNLIIVSPNPNPDAGTFDVTFFAIEGDSGSALVNGANEVVGLIFQRDDEGNAFAYHIDHVLKRLHDADGLTVAVAVATGPNQVHTVPGATFVAVPQEVAELVGADPAERSAFNGADGRVPLGQPWFSDVPPAPATVSRVLGDLAAGDTGRLLLDAWQAHREEVIRLIDRDRRVTIAWHRGGGAALMQLLLRLPADPGRTLPATLDGEPLMRAVDRVRAALARSGSAALRTDLERVRAVLPDLGGRSYAQIVAALGTRELVDG